MEDNKLYFRSSLSQVEGEESRTIKGMAIVFNKWSRDLGGFKERILPSAITNDLISHSDIIANCGHDSQNYMMARSINGKGTLKLNLTSEGLEFEFEAPETAKGDDILYHVRKGNIFECSFAFSLPDNGKGDKWYRDSNGDLCRDVKEIAGLYDISLVSHGAYSDTYCYSRSLEQTIEKEKEINEKLDSIMREIEELTINLENKDENKD